MRKDAMQKKMLAAVYDGKTPRIILESRDIPTLRDIKSPKKYGEGTVLLKKEELVLLKIMAASICGTDLHVLKKEHDSAPPVILGHEYIGKVLKVGASVTNVKKDDIVAVDPNIKCGYCMDCRRGYPNMCRNLTTLGIFIDGGFAEYNVAPARQLFLLPRDISIERAIFFEPVSCAIHALQKVKPMAWDRVLIFGAGPMGCYFTALCSVNGVAKENLTIVEPNDYRRNFAHMLGGTSSSTTDLAEQHGTFDVVIDACGIPDIVSDASDFARPGGTVLLFGQQNIHARTELCPTVLNQKEIHSIGSYVTSFSSEETIKMISDKRIPFEKLITHRVALDNITEAFDAMKSGEAMEVLITPAE